MSSLMIFFLTWLLQAPMPTSQPLPAGVEPSEIFKQMVMRIREVHVFDRQTWKNLGDNWEDGLGGLEAEFIAAKDMPHLQVAIFHLVNSLHNPHCIYSPSRRPADLSLGLEVEVAWDGDNPLFYVSSVTDPLLRDLVKAGDQVLSVDQVASADFMTVFFNDSNANNRKSLASDIARFLSRRRTGRTLVEAGDVSSWTLARPAGHEVYSVTMKWSRGRPFRGLERPDYTSTACDDGSGYGPYRLYLVGNGFCLYASDQMPQAGYPVLRFYTFSYDTRDAMAAARTDHRNLALALDRMKEAKGLILDLRDNRGGLDPNIFLEWFAGGDYRDFTTRLKLVPSLGLPGALEKARITGWDEPTRQAYLTRLDKGGDWWGPRPMFCERTGCEGETVRTYHPTARVTKLPLVLLTGPDCVSSCDHFTFIMQEWSFASLVGQPTASGHTAFRADFPVSTEHDLGLFSLALSEEFSAKTGSPVEAVPIPLTLDLPRTFPYRLTYDEVLVNEAIRLLQEP